MRLMDTLQYRDVEFSKGHVAELHGAKDDQPVVCLDFFTDVGTSSLGYNSWEYRQVLQRLLDENIPAHAPNLYHFKERTKAAERLCHMMLMDRVFFCNSGTESVEAAIKLVRKHQAPRFHIWSYAGGFHGRTLGSLACGDGPPYHYDGFGPLPLGFSHFVKFDEIDWDSAAAVVLAPVFGNNDVRIYPDGWLAELRERCSKNGVMLVFDEVQTGAGRAGEIAYWQRVNVKPDVMTLAKGLGMGCPVGAMLAHGPVATAFTPGSHFSTFGGNPISCAFINGMLEYLSRPRAMTDINNKGRHIIETLTDMGWPAKISPVRGVGMLIAFDIDVDGIQFSEACLAEGLLVGAFRPGHGPVKITPPLNISTDQIDQGLAIMAKAYKQVKA